MTETNGDKWSLDDVTPTTIRHKPSMLASHYYPANGRCIENIKLG